MTDQPPPGSAGRTPTWMRIALGISLAVNLAVAGLLLGSAGRDRWDDRRAGPAGEARSDQGARWGGPSRGGDPGMALSPYVAALPAPDRRALGREVFGKVREEGINLRDLRASVEAVVMGLRADPFVADAVAAELSRQRAALGRVQEVSQTALVARLQAMSAAERTAYADRLESGMRRRGGPGEGRPDTGPGGN